MIPQPRVSKKSKKTKRSSAPSNTLSNDIKVVQTMPTIQSVEPKQQQQNENQSNDLLDLFNFNENTNNNNNNNNVNNNVNNTDDFFNLFVDNNNETSNTNNDQKSRNTVNTLQIHPNLVKPRESRSLEPDALFDVSMWQNFGPQQKQLNTSSNNNRNSTLNFEPINTQKKDEDDDDKKEKEKEKEAKPTKKAPKKPRASAPPTTISSSLKMKDRNKENERKQPQQQQAQKAKETNALVELHRGAALLKYPRRSGFPHFKHIQLSQDNLRIEWFSKRKNLDQTCIWIKDIREVVRGQETEVFKKFHQKTLEKSSFSVVYGHSYKTLDVAAKSIDECEMWVLSILKLVDIYKLNKKEEDLSKLRELFVGIYFKDRNRPMSRVGSGNFIRANSSKNLKIDPVALKEIERDMEALHKTYFKTAQMAQKSIITKSNQYSNIQYVLSELEERIEELTYEVANIRDTELAKREVWRANVDLSAIQEKVEVLLKHLNSKSDRRKSNFI